MHVGNLAQIVSRYASLLLCLSTATWGSALVQAAETGTAIEPGVVEVQGHDLHYVRTGTTQAPLVLFVHGTPGSWEAFRGYLEHPELREVSHMIAVDRLGFGGSRRSGPQPEFDVQSASIGELFNLNRSAHKAIVVGHSLGGSIGFRLALDHPDAVGGFLSISAAINPELGKPRWYNRVGQLPPVRWLIPRGLSIANKEVLPLHRELAAMQPRLGLIDIPVTIVQGGRDPLVHRRNADFAETELLNADLRVARYPDQGHFILWQQPELIVEEILSLLGNLTTH